MKRRLDLGLALVHRPRILFLDEPTTGLDIQSRTALWDEVERLAGEDGVTVFLTTQYLEEADALADRVGIIDHGRIVAEGTPEALKAEIGRPSVEVVPADPGERGRVEAILARFGSDRECPVSSERGVAVRLAGSEAGLAEVVRAMDAEGVEIEHLQLHAPTLSDVFLAKTARQPAQMVPAVVFPLFLLAVNSSGLESATRLPGFPTGSYLTFALAVHFIQAGLFAVLNGGTDLARDVETGFLDRLALTPLSGLGLLLGQLAGVLALTVFQVVVFLCVGLIAGAHFDAGVGGFFVLLALALTIALAFGGIGMFAALRLGSGEAVQGLFPVFFVFLFLSSMSLPRNLISTDWFRTVATYNPVSYLIEGVRSLFLSGWDAEALALAFGLGAIITVASMAAATAALRTRLVRT